MRWQEWGSQWSCDCDLIRRAAFLFYLFLLMNHAKTQQIEHFGVIRNFLPESELAGNLTLDSKPQYESKMIKTQMVHRKKKQL